jgi:hypothetical protein
MNPLKIIKKTIRKIQYFVVVKLYLRFLNLRHVFTRQSLGINVGFSPITRDTENPNHVPYQPAYIWHLKKIMNCLDIKSSDKLLDYGSGKGAAMLFFSQYPFGEIAGVEYDEALHETAVENFQKKGLTHLVSHNGNATLFTDIDNYNYFFFFNPFLNEVMESTIEQIRQSLIRNPRKITILYQNPQERNLFANSKLFPYRMSCFVSSWINVDKYGRRIDIYCTESLHLDFEKYGVRYSPILTPVE